jgi:hypothetical protein
MTQPLRVGDAMTLDGGSTVFKNTLLCDSYYKAFHESCEISNTSLRFANLLSSLLLIDDSGAAHMVSQDILLPAITDVSRCGVAGQPFDISNRTFYTSLHLITYDLIRCFLHVS